MGFAQADAIMELEIEEHRQGSVGHMVIGDGVLVKLGRKNFSMKSSMQKAE